jgi:multiple sugar transport system permease protein
VSQPVGPLGHPATQVGLAGRRGRERAVRAWLSRVVNSDAVAGYVLLLPTLIGLAVFSLGPVVTSALLSFTRWDGLSTPVWTGTENYRLLFTDPLFWTALRNTAYYTVGSVVPAIVLSLLLALAVNQKIKGVVFFRTLFFLPVVSPPVAIAILWGWLYNAQYGVINAALDRLGLSPVQWLAEPSTAMPSIIIMSIWSGLGYNMVLFLAGLQGIPQELYEAAKIDGANRWALFRHVTVPLLSPTTFFILVLSMIGAFQLFDYAYVLTGGGPMYSTLSIVLYIYQMAFQNFKMGYASALAYVLFVIIATVTFVQFRLQRRWVHYE